VRESRPRGSVRGALSNERPYRENPWAQLFLAEALTLGEGGVADKAEALRLLLAIMNQDREPLAKARAAKALSRLQNGRS
jgi:hypothetical protein